MIKPRPGCGPTSQASRALRPVRRSWHSTAPGSDASTTVAGPACRGRWSTAGVDCRSSNSSSGGSSTRSRERPTVGVFWVAVSHAGPSLITSGSAAQQEFHLPRILSGESIWCQGFSEPDAGSDLAGIRASARRDGDAFVVNGQKIWTTHGQHGDFQELLVRTERDPGSRHKGLTWLTAHAQPRHRCPADHDHGGSAALLRGVLRRRSDPDQQRRRRGRERLVDRDVDALIERGAGFVVEQISLGRFLDEVVDYAATHTGPDGRRTALADEGLRGRIATARAELAALRATTYAAVSRNRRAGAPGPEGSISRLLFAELDQRIRARRWTSSASTDSGDRFRRPLGPGRRVPVLTGGDDRRRNLRHPAQHHRQPRPRTPALSFDGPAADR